MEKINEIKEYLLGKTQVSVAEIQSHFDLPYSKARKAVDELVEKKWLTISKDESCYDVSDKKQRYDVFREIDISYKWQDFNKQGVNKYQYKNANDFIEITLPTSKSNEVQDKDLIKEFCKNNVKHTKGPRNKITAKRIRSRYESHEKILNELKAAIKRCEYEMQERQLVTAESIIQFLLPQNIDSFTLQDEEISQRCRDALPSYLVKKESVSSRSLFDMLSQEQKSMLREIIAPYQRLDKRQLIDQISKQPYTAHDYNSLYTQVTAIAFIGQLSESELAELKEYLDTSV